MSMSEHIEGRRFLFFYLCQTPERVIPAKVVQLHQNLNILWHVIFLVVLIKNIKYLRKTNNARRSLLLVQGNLDLKHRW